MSADLAALAEVIVSALREHFPAEGERERNVLALAEEAGEYVGAYRRWAGMARRPGPWADVESELADVVITAYVNARVLGIDLDRAWRAKAAVICPAAGVSLPRPRRTARASRRWAPPRPRPPRAGGGPGPGRARRCPVSRLAESSHDVRPWPICAGNGAWLLACLACAAPVEG